MFQPSCLFAAVVALLATSPQPPNDGPGGITWIGTKTELVDTLLSEHAAAILGVPRAAGQVQYVATLTDRRPYGDPRSPAKIIECGEVPIDLDERTRIQIGISLAFTSEKRELLCAFTAVGAAPPQKATSEDIKARESLGRQFAPAHYSELRSSIADVLAAAWRYHHIDPREAAQVVLRPRWVVYEGVTDSRTGAPAYAPANIWIVEVLGFDVQFPHGHPRAIILHLRDGDLEHLWGDVLY